MSNGFATRVQLRLNSSPALTAALLCGHAVGAAAALCISLPMTARVAICAGVVASLVRALRVHALRRSSKSLVGLELDSSGCLRVRQAGDDRWRRAEIRQASVFRALIVLRLRGDDVPSGVVIPADSADAEALRRFRAALRMRNWEAREWCPARRGADRENRG